MSDLPEAQQLIGRRILAHAQSRCDKFSFDPFTIMAICNCIISVVKLLYMCYSKEKMMSAIRSDNIIHRYLIRKEIRKNFKDKDERKALYKSFSEVSKTLSEKELFDLMESIQE